jgi:SAM-dependent methyltransferase
MADVADFKTQQQQTYTTADFGLIARTSVLVGALLCEAVDLRPGQRVLDVATGTGNTALVAARRGCEVIGLDWTPASPAGPPRGAPRSAVRGRRPLPTGAAFPYPIHARGTYGRHYLRLSHDVGTCHSHQGRLVGGGGARLS